MIAVAKKILKKKMLAGGIALVLIVGGYFGYKAFFSTPGEIRYITARAQKGTVIVSLSGSGQVSASNQIDIKPKVSGDVAYVGVKNGQEVKAGTLIAQLNAQDAQKSVRDAQVNLESAKLSLEKLKKPADALTMLQAENTLAQARESKQKAEDTLKKSYDDGFNTIANAFLDVPSIMTGLNGILFDRTFDRNQDNITWYMNQTSLENGERNKASRYRDELIAAYDGSRAAYLKNFDDYKSASRASDTQTIESLIVETYETTKMIADTIKTTNNYLDFIQDIYVQHRFSAPSAMATQQSSIDSYTGTTNNHLLNLLSIKNTIQTNKETIVNAERTIAEKTESYAQLKAGADALDIASSKLSVTQRENALRDAQEKLADYFIRAPFNGVIAKLTVKKGDAASSGTSLATLLAKQRIAELSLNEMDAAKINVGQKATLTFDAVADLTLTGEVMDMDAVGTVSQGVVTYTVKIGFDAQDERVKPGMSVSAAIITDAKPDALMVPLSAVKTTPQGNADQTPTSYVQIAEGDNGYSATAAKTNGITLTTPPRRQTVETGIANDEFIEIVSGLQEGNVVVTSTINPTTTSNAATNQQSSSAIRIPGLSGGGFRGGEPR